MFTIWTVYRVVSEAALPPDNTYKSTYKCGCVYERERERMKEAYRVVSGAALPPDKTYKSTFKCGCVITPITVPLNVVVCMKERKGERKRMSV